MDLTEYCIKLREKGEGTAEIKKQLSKKGIQEEEILKYLRLSDSIFLYRLKNKRGKKRRLKSILRTDQYILLFVLFILLNYSGIGFFVLIILYSYLLSNDVLRAHKLNAPI